MFILCRIFSLDHLAIFMTEFLARLELGAINFHLKPCMFTWSKIGFPFEVIISIGTVFKTIQLSFDIYRVSNHQVLSSWYPSNNQWTTQFIQISLSHHFLPFLHWILAWEHQDHACRLVVANVTFQYPAAPLQILQSLSMCNDNVPLFGGGLPLDVLSILEAAGHNVVIRLWG